MKSSQTGKQVSRKNPAGGRAKCRGSVLVFTTVLLLIMTTLGLAMFTLTTTSGRLANAGYEKVQANAAAEAGIHSLYAQIAAALDAGTTTPVSSIGTLTSTIGGVSRTDGSYSAAIASSATAGLVTTYSIGCTGTASNGKTNSVTNATFTTTSTTGGAFHFPNGSIVSNGPITIGNSHTGTVDDSSSNNASIFANGDISTGNNASVSGSVTTATSYTGKGSVSGTVTTGTSTPFPSAATLSAYQANWLSTAQSGTQYAACPATNTTITAPAYINGNLDQNLNIKPCAGANSVVYVNGNISGDIYIPGDGNSGDSVTIVCTGTFTSQNLTGVNEPYSCTIVTLDTTTIDFSNSSRGTIEGVIYAANAGFDLKNPSWTFDGCLIAGGTSGVSFGNGGGNATVHYPGNNLNSNSQSFAIASKISTLSSWVQTQ